MKAVLLVIGACAVLALGAFAIFTSTEGDRAADARETLDRAANEFVQCYARSRSYERCDPGTSKIAVTLRRRTEFSLTSTLEFGPSYTIARRGEGRLARSCQHEGSQCPAPGWPLAR